MFLLKTKKEAKTVSFFVNDKLVPWTHFDKLIGVSSGVAELYFRFSNLFNLSNHLF